MYMYTSVRTNNEMLNGLTDDLQVLLGRVHVDPAHCQPYHTPGDHIILQR